MLTPNPLMSKHPSNILVKLSNDNKLFCMLRLSREVGTGYSHGFATIKKLEVLGLVITLKKGRSRYIKLTKKGKEVAAHIINIKYLIE